jgi:transcription elongation factor GreA
VTETTTESTTVADAVQSYLASLPVKARQEQTPEMNRLVRWSGADRRLSDIRVIEMERYVETVNKSVDAENRLKVLRSFLSFARKNGLVSDNLNAVVRPRRTGGGSTQTAMNEERLDVTAEGLAALERELEALRAQRPQIAEALRAAMADKDFRENAPLDAAREHQAHVEARIRELEAMLKRAVVVETGGGHTIRLGSRVRLRDLQNGREVRYVLVGPGEVNASEGKISVSSPVGRALVDRRPGEEVEVAAPARTFHYRIEEIEA